MSLSEKQRKFTVMVGNFILWAHGAGYELTYGHVWRDKETQARLVEKGLSKTLASKHCDRLAVDFNLFVDGKYVDDKEVILPLFSGHRVKLLFAVLQMREAICSRE